MIAFVLYIHSVAITLILTIFSANESIYVDNNCLNCIMQDICVPELFLGLFVSVRGGDMLSAISCRISKGSVKNILIYLYDNVKLTSQRQRMCQKARQIESIFYELA